MENIISRYYVIKINATDDKITDVYYADKEMIEAYGSDYDYLDRVFGNYYAYVRSNNFAAAKDRAYNLLRVSRTAKISIWN